MDWKAREVNNINGFGVRVGAHLFVGIEIPVVAPYLVQGKES